MLTPWHDSEINPPGLSMGNILWWDMDMEKAFPTDMAGRIREIKADPCNQWIPRVPTAGKIVDGKLVMHNGLRVNPMHVCYMDVLTSNGGCHEPQEEFLFQEVLKHIPRRGVMLELGAYWGFYSIWFAMMVEHARCFLVEPEAEHLEVGKRNFADNGFAGTFFQQLVGRDAFQVDKFMQQYKIKFLDLLHADLQCAELEMLEGAERSLTEGRVGYVFVGTHGQDLHYRCKEFLEKCGYTILAHADWEHGTFCQDGLLLARRKELAGMEPIDIPLRQPHQPYTIGSSQETLYTLLERGSKRRGPISRAIRWIKTCIRHRLPSKPRCAAEEEQRPTPARRNAA